MHQLEEHIFLIGFMGVGKSTVARMLSRQLGVKEYDTDRMIVARDGREISQIFAEDGELAFRKMETDLLEDLKGYPPSIIACGGGVAMRTENVECMKRQGKMEPGMTVNMERDIRRITIIRFLWKHMRRRSGLLESTLEKTG